MGETKFSSSYECSAFDNVSKSLSEAERLQSLGAFIHIDTEGALEAARLADKKAANGESIGPLHGVPIVIKDNIHVAGLPNSAGTASLKNFVPDSSNAAVEALIDAGAIVIGKTNMHEMAFGITSNNVEFGPVRNACDPNVFAGGSSGGTAVAVASNIVTMGLGTDTGGSTRIPATLNGVVGLRPTLGRYDSTDVTPLATTRDTVGPIAKSVGHVALMDSIITGTPIGLEAASLNQLRLGIPKEYFYADLSEEVADNLKSVLIKLEAAGVVLVDIDLPNLKEINENISSAVSLYEFNTLLPIYLERHNTGVQMEELISQLSSPDVIGAAESQRTSEAVSVETYEKAINVYRPKLKSLYGEAFSSFDVDAFLVPATLCAAQAIETSDDTIELNGEQVPTFPTFIRNTDPTSNAGLPSLALPTGKTNDGLPIGILLDGPEDSDRRLLEIAVSIESLLLL